MFTNRKGITLIEIMITMGILSVVIVLTYIAVATSLRSVKTEATILEMDRSASQALQHMADVLRPALLPIPVNAPDTLLGEFSRNIINNPVRGFGGGNGVAWSAILREGTDCLPFCTPVDYGSDGDCLDGDNYLELGITLPDGSIQFGGDYHIDGDHNKLDENASVHAGLARLKPSSLGLPDAGASINANAPRFARRLSFPAGADSGFALLRFVPAPSPENSNAPMTFREQDIDCDLNDDGDTADTFLLGHMEIAYPTLGKTVSGQSVLLQINRDASWTPIFKQVRYREKDSSPNGVFDENNQGQYGILIRLLMLDGFGQNSPLLFKKGKRALVRQYETVVKLRNMAAN